MRSQLLEELAHCTRLLALNIGHYQSTYGQLPRHEMIALLRGTAGDGAQGRLLAEGMDALMSVLAEASDGRAGTDAGGNS